MDDIYLYADSLRKVSGTNVRSKQVVRDLLIKIIDEDRSYLSFTYGTEQVGPRQANYSTFDEFVHEWSQYTVRALRDLFRGDDEILGLLDFATSKSNRVAERIIGSKKLRDQGMTQQQIADKHGVSQKTVSNDLVKNRVYTQKTTKPKRKVIQYKISQYTTADTAATKIRDKFGDEFADQLKELL